ncbi:hypothetical protein D3C73_1656380 [compost metagenome]
MKVRLDPCPDFRSVSVIKTANSPAVNNSQDAQYLEWTDSRTKISYTIYVSGGEITKEALVSLAEQIITGQS